MISDNRRCRYHSAACLLSLSLVFFLSNMKTSGQNIGIGITNPKARLHIADSSILFSAAGAASFNAGNTPVTGAGRRMMWYADKAAFRTGYVQGMNWDKDSIGDYSFAAGWNPNAPGYSSVSIGGSTVARGYYSVAMGFRTSALQQGAVALGDSAVAFGGSSFASGGYTKAMAPWSTAMGAYTQARGQSSFAVGIETITKSNSSTVVGIYNDTTDSPHPFILDPLDRIFQVGNGVAGARSNAITILRNGRVGIGKSNPDYPLSFADVTGDKISLYGGSGPHYGLGIQSYLMQIHTDDILSDIAFGYGSSASFTETMRIKGDGKVGIGVVSPSEKLHIGPGAVRIDGPAASGGNALSIGGYGDVQVDAFGIVGGRLSVKENGNVGIGTNFPTAKLCVNGSIAYTSYLGACSDIRYKKGFTPFDHPLRSLLSLNGFYYFWKSAEFPGMSFNDDRQIGFSAQEVEKLFPEMVMTDASGYKSVDYGRLTPVLVEAIKEQQKQIDELNKETIRMRAELDDLKKTVEKLIR